MSSGPDRLPLTVIGGYLGAGKTTLLNGILARPDGQRIAVLVNDFGDVDIDGRLLASAAGDVLTLANGCICCSMADGFAETLETVRGFADRIDRVVVEVSGVGEPRRVARWAHLPGFTPDGVVVLVDPLSVRERATDRYVGETVINQVAGADLVVMSRSDVADEADLTGTEAWLSTTTDATVLRAPLPTAVLLGPAPRNLSTRTDAEADSIEDGAATPASPSHDHVSISRHLDGPIPRSSIDTWIRARPGGVVRAKGLVRVDDRPDDRTVLQVCGSTTTVTVDGPWDGGAEAVVAIALPGTPRAALVKWLNLLG
jgi:G3E family GTPase